MSQSKITIQATVNADSKKVWDCYTNPKHIVNWNFADPSWHCPAAENDMKIGGTYKARMEARDGSFGFDLKLFILRSLRANILLTALVGEKPPLYSMIWETRQKWW